MTEELTVITTDHIKKVDPLETKVKCLEETVVNLQESMKLMSNHNSTKVMLLEQRILRLEKIIERMDRTLTAVSHRSNTLDRRTFGLQMIGIPPNGNLFGDNEDDKGCDAQ